MMNRRSMLRGTALAAAAAGVGMSSAGCGHDTGDEITFFFQAAPDEATVRMRIIDEFRRRHPDIGVRVEMSGPDPQQQLLTYCAGGKCPDVLMSWESYSRLAELGALQDLSGFLAADRAFADELRRDCAPGLYETFHFRGGQYALPEQWAGVFLYYNKRLFAEAELEPPPRRWSDAWTFDQFLKAAEALTKREPSGRTSQWGFIDAWTVPHYSASIFAMNNGAQWFSPVIDPNRAHIADPRFVEGFQFYADLATRYQVAPKPENLQSVSGIDLFSQGRAGMALTGHWMYPALRSAADLDFDVTVLPVGPHGSHAASDIGTTGLSVAAACPRKRQAWEFVKFATGPVGQAIIAESGLFVPTLRSARQSEGFARAHSRLHNLDVFTEGPDNANHIPVTPAWARVDDTFRRRADRVLRGAATAADTFTPGLAHELDTLLAGAV